MTTEYIDYGESLEKSETSNLPAPLRDVAEACSEHSAYDVVEFRRISPDSHALIVDVGDGTFDAKNRVGIRRFERLALVYSPNLGFPWEVRALRSDFPVTMHQNHVEPNSPRSLCLYVEPWSSVERVWNPQSFLGRVLWWLRESACENLHQEGQPLEQLFFEPAHRFVLPEDYFERLGEPGYRIVFDQPPLICRNRVVYKARVSDEKSHPLHWDSQWIPLTVIPPPITHGRVEEHPKSVADLIQKLEARGASIGGLLREAIKGLVPEGQSFEWPVSKANRILLVLGISLKREGDAERTDVYGFALEQHLGLLGEDLGALIRSPGENKWYRDDGILQKREPQDPDRLESYFLEPVGIKLMPSKQQVRDYSGISGSACDLSGVISGLGSLGSAVASIWAREGWGEWEYVDHDAVEPHNLSRHISFGPSVGMPKSELMSAQAAAMFSFEVSHGSLPKAHVRGLTEDFQWLENLLEHKDIIVDASTTLEVPRDLSGMDRSARVATIFITPSGRSSVLLMEDQSGHTRSLSLEAQYYRAILTNDSWGTNHLEGNAGSLWVGAGCRDITMALSNELIWLHGSILARQLRLLSDKEEAQIKIWDCDGLSGAVSAHDIQACKPIHAEVGGWTVWWDVSIEDGMSRLRNDELPNETGGILLGFVDQKIKTISVVLARPAPEDSTATPKEFLRGTAGVEGDIDECRRRTGGIVSYLGEWHSHPRGCKSDPSTHDRKQLDYLEDVMARDGSPAISMIVSDSTISVSLGQQTTTVELSFFTLEEGKI